MRRIRKPNGEDPWQSDDPVPIMVKHGYGAMDLTIGNHKIEIPNSDFSWHRYTYGDFRRKFGERWAKAWLFRTNDPHDPERLDMLKARVDGISGLPTLMPDPNDLRDGSWQDVTF